MRDTENNREPVHYCKLCLSLSIRTIEFEKGSNGEDRDLDYCNCCKGSDIGKASIGAWEMMYEEKHGEKFLDQKKTCR